MIFMVVLVMLSPHTACRMTILETNSDEERSQRGIALLNHAYRSFISGNYPSCLMACMDDSQCMSYNFWWNTSVCDLNKKTKHSAEPKFLIQDMSSTYMGLKREPGKHLSTSLFSIFFSILERCLKSSVILMIEYCGLKDWGSDLIDTVRSP